jgi:hypothetical protein
MRTYHLAPWDMHRLTASEVEAIARDLRALDKAAKG